MFLALLQLLIIVNEESTLTTIIIVGATLRLDQGLEHFTQGCSGSLHYTVGDDVGNVGFVLTMWSALVSSETITLIYLRYLFRVESTGIRCPVTSEI